MVEATIDSFDRAFLGFAHFLMGLGIETSQLRIQTAYRVVAALGGLEKCDHLYWAGRVSFCSSREDLVIYDRAFQAWFHELPAIASKSQAPEHEILVATPVGGHDLSEDGGLEEEKKSATASEREFLRNADLALLSPKSKAQVEEWISSLRPMGLTRKSRRFDLGGSSMIDRRKSVRRALKSGGEISEIIFRSRRVVPRRVLFLIDVSGSMRAYSSAYLRFAYATKKVRRNTEVFTVGTRLTRVTPALTGANVQRAISRALEEIPDWSGGTRLGIQFRSFIREYWAKGTARGAIVVIASDGWERGDVMALGESVAQLSRLAKRIIWVNPHLHRPGFSPLTAGMEIVLPNIDRLVSGHSFRSFEDLCKEIAG